MANSVRGRVGLHSTRYRGLHDRDGRDWITLDGQELVNMPHWYGWCRRGARADGGEQAGLSDDEPLFQYGSLGRALFDYLTLSIDDILGSPNVLIRALGTLDRRLGKRRLKSLVDDNAHPLVRLLHRFRCEAEGLTLPPSPAADEVDLRRPASPPRDRNEERRRADARLRAGKKRDARNLIARIWQGELAEDDLDTDLACLTKSAISDFRFVEGAEQANNMQVWRVRELLNSEELRAEGRRMQHCVASFARSGHSGACSIWSLSCETDEGLTPRLTIEVHATSKEIRQARGERNRRPTTSELDVLRRWASQEGLTIPSYV